MDFEYFENLSKEQAQALLKEFLADGRANVDIVRAHAEAAGVRADYSLATLPEFLQWVASQLRTVPRAPDPNVPEWIRSTLDYERGLFDFDARSGNLIVFAAYYMGECFVRSYPHLRWATGNRKQFEQNMPVVTGFRYSKELAPMMVLENTFRAYIENQAGISRVITMVNAWRENAEAAPIVPKSES
jgi:hypothetical protein